MTITELLHNFYGWKDNTITLKDGKIVLKSAFFSRCIAMAICWFEDNLPNHPVKKYFYRLLKKARPDNIVCWYSILGLFQGLQKVLDPEGAKEDEEYWMQKKKSNQELMQEIEQTMQEIDGMVQEDTQDMEQEGGNEDGKVVE